MSSTPPTHGVLHLFCDANLFLQCRPLDDLDWSSWQHYQSVRLIVSDPVLREIDGLKNKGNDRQSKRARNASATFRSMRPSGTKVIQDSDPTLTLHIERQHRRSDELAGKLDYSERDDQLIGTIYEFAQSQPEVRLLTHDTTPLYTAEGVGLTVELIPDDWLLAPEPDARDKQISVLKDQVKQLTDIQPAFTVRFEDHTDQEVAQYEPVVDLFTPLTPSQIDQLMHRLKQLHPIATTFGRREQTAPDELAAKFFAPQGTKFFVPATDDDVADYKQNAYPDWLARCEKFLSDCHQLLQEQQTTLRFTFLVENQGKCPAKDCLITIESLGNLLIMPPRTECEDDDDEDQQKPTPDNLPAPPSPPRGHWRSSALVRAIVEPFGVNQVLPDVGRLMHPIPSARDPNALYYKPIRPEEPVAEFSLECQQWRHADGWLALSGELHLPGQLEDTKGAIVFRLQAENLPEPHKTLIPVRVSVRHTSAFEKAHDLVENLQP